METIEHLDRKKNKEFREQIISLAHDCNNDLGFQLSRHFLELSLSGKSGATKNFLTWINDNFTVSKEEKSLEILFCILFSLIGKLVAEAEMTTSY